MPWAFRLAMKRKIKWLNPQTETEAEDQQGQHQQPRGILPSETLNALDNLVDRLNFSSGRLPNNINSSSTNDDGDDDDVRPLPIRALL
eukprot:scaffold12741_cov93-Skeletonema_dohrnii-CCMP3373.AAC.1